MKKIIMLIAAMTITGCLRPDSTYNDQKAESEEFVRNFHIPTKDLEIEFGVGVDYSGRSTCHAFYKHASDPNKKVTLARGDKISCNGKKLEQSFSFYATYYETEVEISPGQEFEFEFTRAKTNEIYRETIIIPPKPVFTNPLPHQEIAMGEEFEINWEAEECCKVDIAVGLDSADIENEMISSTLDRDIGWFLLTPEVLNPNRAVIETGVMLSRWQKKEFDSDLEGSIKGYIQSTVPIKLVK